MKIRKGGDVAVETPRAGKPTQAESAKWTNGNAFSSKVVTAVVIAAVACGPIALLTSRSNQGAPVAAAPVTAKPALTVLQQSAGAYAIGYVGAWLRATQTDSTALNSYIDSNSVRLSQTPFDYQNIAVASVDAAPGHMVSVIVAADVKDASITDKSVQTWPRRYFHVTVSATGNTLSAVTLPAPVAGPKASTESPDVGYPATLSADSKAAQPVMLFLAAYLSGQGETEPYTSPSTSIPAIKPAPYSSVSPLTVSADHAPSASPADGDKLAVLATVTVQNAVGQKLTATYALDLRARAGRWEVASLNSSPVVAQAADSIAPKPSPTGAGNQEGK